MTCPKKLTSQKEFIEYVIQGNNILYAGLIGFCGVLVLSIISMISIFVLGRNLPNEFQRLLTKAVFHDGLFFIYLSNANANRGGNGSHGGRYCRVGNSS
jgi:hypothetical protein